MAFEPRGPKGIGVFSVEESMEAILVIPIGDDTTAGEVCLL